MRNDHGKTRMGATVTAEGAIEHLVVHRGGLIFEAPVKVIVSPVKPKSLPWAVRDYLGRPVYALPGGGWTKP